MLDIWMLNVGKGDSIALRYTDNNKNEFYGVIDSNTANDGVDPEAVKFLKGLKVKEISFLLLTHPHHDHFSGISKIFNNFSISHIYTYPFGIDDKNLVKKWAELYKKNTGHIEASAGKINERSLEMLRVLAEFEKNSTKLMELFGPHNRIKPFGFHTEQIELHVILPYKKNKGEIFQRVRGEEIDVVNNPNLNKLSASLLVKYKNKSVVFGADSTYECWIRHKKDNHFEPLNSDIFKVNHHGSDADCKDEVFQYIFGDKHEKIALISSNGNQHHPSDKTLKRISEMGIKPYCTNLSLHCGHNIHNLYNNPNIPAETRNFINLNNSPRLNIPCQGRVHINIDTEGELKIDSEYKNFCPYRDSIF